jgi:hypothetical protein
MPLAAAVLRRLSERARRPHDAGGLRLLSDVLHSLTVVSWNPQRGYPACIFPVEFGHANGAINDGFIALVDRWYETCSPA